MAIAQFKSLSYIDYYGSTDYCDSIVYYELIDYYGSTDYYYYYYNITKKKFYECKNFGKQNLNLEAIILSFNIFNFILIILAMTIIKYDLQSDCPMSSADCCELFFASENEQNRENIGRINNIFEEKKRNQKEIKELKKENEKLKNMMKI